MSSFQVTLPLFLTQFPYVDVSYARSMLVFSPYHSIDTHLRLLTVRIWHSIYIIIAVTWSEVLDHVKCAGTSCRSNVTRSVDFVEVIRAWQRDGNKHFGSSYCNNDKFIIYPFPVIEKVWNEYLGSTVQRLFTKEKYISKKNYRNFYKPWAKSWVKNHFECIRKIRLCLGVGVVSFILKQIK